MKAYLVVALEITNMGRFSEYIERIPKQIEKHRGRYLVKGVEPEVVEGEWLPERLVILEFDSSENARQFLADPESKALFKIRHASTQSNILLAEGCS